MYEVSKAMNSLTKLSVSTRYYVRNLLRQHGSELRPIASQGADFHVNSQANLDQLLESLYPEEAKAAVKVRQLETLIQRHQTLTVQNLSSTEMLVEVERRIFETIGLKRVAIGTTSKVKVTVEELVNALNQLSQFSKSYLGATLTANNWQATRPDLDWLDNFQIDRSAEIRFSSVVIEFVSVLQLRRVQEWVTAFIKRVSQTIRDFAAIVKQKKIGELQKGFSLIHANLDE